MKETEGFKEAHERMHPGHITAQGFLGADGRPLADIVARDEGEFRRLGLTFEGVAAELRRLRDEGRRGLGEPISVGGAVVTVGDARGLLPCPWDDGTFHKDSVTVERGGTRVVYSDLSIHMLEKHHFCQGEGSAFRLDPGALKRIAG
ncbi:MAG TPA: hypothetical protein PKW82_01275 [Spirochaetales bacterium]|nr:hypothetical protein [Spirochaetales bacterium]